MSTRGTLEVEADHLIWIIDSDERRRIRESDTARARALHVMQWAADTSGLEVRAVTARGREPFLWAIPGVVELAVAC
jgi:hypothetical protein